MSENAQKTSNSSAPGPSQYGTSDSNMVAAESTPSYSTTTGASKANDGSTTTEHIDAKDAIRALASEGVNYNTPGHRQTNNQAAPYSPLSNNTVGNPKGQDNVVTHRALNPFNDDVCNWMWAAARAQRGWGHQYGARATHLGVQGPCASSGGWAAGCIDSLRLR